MKLVKKEPPEGEGINMTPMIDVVFQLLIFFMVCSDMSINDAAQLTLPMVSQAVPDQGEVHRHTISVEKDGTIYVGKVQVSLDQLDEEVLRVEAEIYKKKGKDAISEKPILIRADREVRFGVIQGIMERCVRRKIYKLSFGARMPGGAKLSTTGE